LSKICIYGLGALFYECYEQIIDMVDVDYLFDINKQGEIVFNKKVLTLEELKKLDKNTTIIIAVRNYSNIYLFLKDLGFKDILYFKYERGNFYIKSIKKISFKNARLLDLTKKRAFITGSNRGIGAFIAKMLAQKGIELILHTSNKQKCDNLYKELKNLVKIEILEANLEYEDEIKNMLKSLESFDIDIVYNNAGVSLFSNDFEVDYYTYVKTYKINTLAPIMISNFFIRKWENKEYARIVNMGSTISKRLNELSYSLSKIALEKYVYDIIPFIKNKNILISLIDPGWVKTDMGGKNALHSIDTLNPGILVPIFMDNYKQGSWFYAQDVKHMKLTDAINFYKGYYGV